LKLRGVIWRGAIITAAYLGIQRVNNEKGGAAFENAEIMPPGRRENGGDSTEKEREGEERRGSRASRREETARGFLKGVAGITTARDIDTGRARGEGRGSRACGER